MLTAGFADADVILTQPLGEHVGDAIQMCHQTGHISYGSFGKICGLIWRHVARWPGGEQVLYLSGREPVPRVGPAPVGERLGVLGDYLAAIITAGQFQVNAEPDEQQRGPAAYR